MHTYTHIYAHAYKETHTHTQNVKFLDVQTQFLTILLPSPTSSLPPPTPFHSILSYPIPFHPIPFHTTLFHLIPYNSIPSHSIPLYPFPLEGNLHCLLALGEYVELEDSALALRNHLKNAEQVEEYSSWMAEVQKLGPYVTFSFDSFNI